MAQSGSGFDMSKMSTANKIVGGGAVAFLIWTFLPVWYRCCSVLGFSANISGVSGFRGATLIAALLALLAVVGVVLTVVGVEMRMSVKPGLIQLGFAGLGLLFTLLGFVTKPTGTTLSWGIFVGLLLALVWTYGAYMWYSEPAGTAPPSSGGGGGFTS